MANLTRVYYPHPLTVGAQLNLPLEIQRHLITVLRLKLHDEFILFNGYGGDYIARIIGVEKKSMAVEVTSFTERNTQSPIAIELGQAITRGEKMDYIIQKATELGVQKITPLITERCNLQLKADRLAQRYEHWFKVMIHACEQSGRCDIPELMQPISLINWLAQNKTGIKLVCSPTNSNPLNNLSSDEHHASLLIGPEGGLTTHELLAATEHDFMSLSLGPRILRTETASLAAITLLQYQFGDF